ncbi:hypothetical protein [Pyxidicoccus trucidator]|uniref:hypothetical protein n=1 Tax=Pyxidicoccus trucidator TaxID=2709662 RepID=UPI0013DCA9C4|nr:hypothetical protein [Pyxidicoccus trucidator]
MNQRDVVRSRGPGGARRGAWQALARFVLPGLMLGLPLAGLVMGEPSEAAQEPLPPDPWPLKCERYHDVVVVDFRGEGIAFLPDRCLNLGGTVRFINHCKDKTLVKVTGHGPDRGLLLPVHGEDNLVLKRPGVYTITVADGCPELPQDSRTGTLEVATDPGP